MDPIYKDLTNLFQHSCDLVFVTDTKGIIQAINSWGIRILGYTPEEVVGSQLTDFCVNGRECQETLAWVISEASVCVCNLETKFLKKNGDEVDFNLTLSRHNNSDGSATGIVGIGRDITEKKKMEIKFRSIQRELENFVYVVSHDLKSPLLSMEGYTSMLIRGYTDLMDDKGKHYLERIQWNIHKMESLLTGMLEISRIGQVIGELTEVNMGEIVSEVLEEIEPLLKQKGGTVAVSNHFPKVWCDRNRMTQVFENLLSNAVKFTGDQPEPRIEVGCHDRGRDYEFFVKDNGIGIDPAYHEKVFGIFQRLEEIKVEGTGVGLTIAKRIVENHDGRIWVDSKPRQGATFYFTIGKGRWKNGTHSKIKNSYSGR